MIVKLVRNALPSTALIAAFMTACAHPAAPPATQGLRVGDPTTELPADDIHTVYYSDDSFTTRVGDVLRSCLPGPIVRRGRTSDYYFQYQQSCSPPPKGLTTYRCVDGFCQEI